MVVCSVPGCAAKGTKIFHSFPRNAAIRKLWMKRTKTTHLTEKELNSYAKVCKYHFRESDFEINPRGQQGLKKNAVPSVNLPTDSTVGEESNYALASEDEHVKRKRCRTQQPNEVFDEPLANPHIDEEMINLNEIETDLHEVVLVDRNQFVTVSIEQIKELEKFADDRKMYEQKSKEYEKVIKEMCEKQKQNEFLISTLLNKDRTNQKKIKKTPTAVKRRKIAEA